MGHLLYILVVYLFDTKVEKRIPQNNFQDSFFFFFLLDHISKRSKKRKKKKIRCANIDLKIHISILWSLYTMAIKKSLI